MQGETGHGSASRSISHLTTFTGAGLSQDSDAEAAEATSEHSKSSSVQCL